MDDIPPPSPVTRSGAHGEDIEIDDTHNDEDDIAELFGDFDEPEADMDHGDDGTDGDDDAMHVATCMNAIADNLQTLGVQAETSVGYASTVVRTSRKPGFIELYGRGGFIEANKLLPSLNIEGLHALDLATFKPDGKPWNFSNSADRKIGVKLIEDTNPDWVI